MGAGFLLTHDPASPADSKRVSLKLTRTAPPHSPYPQPQSSNVAYKYGVSGPFWYASGATIQVLLFAILAVEIKRKVRGHTPFSWRACSQGLSCRW